MTKATTKPDVVILAEEFDRAVRAHEDAEYELRSAIARTKSLLANRAAAAKALEDARNAMMYHVSKAQPSSKLMAGMSPVSDADAGAIIDALEKTLDGTQ